MQFIDYQNGVLATWNGSGAQITNAALGLAGETGEVMELIKKDQFHGKPYTTDLLVKELGDVLYYLTALCELHGTTLEHVAEVNNAKLRARYPEGFVTGGGNR